jgi:hypothetical protein
MKSKVYFAKKETDNKAIDKIIENIDFSKLGNNIGIKLHFGEKGCNTYLNPEIAKAIYDKIISLGKKASLIECNVLYRGSRTNSKEHIKTAKQHGFDFGNIDILDGENGQKSVEVDVGGIAQKAKLGKGLEKYDSLICVSHFKGHMMAGFGGAFKNMGMGLGSRAGKLHMHSNISPSINKSRCIGCGICAENCDVNAISINNGKAEINNKCIGCAMCIAVCPQKAVAVPWHGATSEQLQKKIVEYTFGVIKKIGNKNIIYINVLENITEECDCMGIKQSPIMQDIGILLSHDIVAIDKASLDLADKFSNNKFGSINSADNNIQINYAEEKGLGNKDYEIIEI